MLPDPSCGRIVRSAAFLQDRERAPEERLGFMGTLRSPGMRKNVVSAVSVTPNARLTAS
jgi:hypothetical protein